jgi:hypothetical protein
MLSLQTIRDEMKTDEPNLTPFTDYNEIVELNLIPSFSRVTMLPTLGYLVGQVQVFT